jgi:hypothetical protein
MVSGWVLAMQRFRLVADQVQVELVSHGSGDQQPFQVLGSSSEVAFLEELLKEEFGSLNVNPAALFSFLKTDHWVQQHFNTTLVLEGELQASETPSTSFNSLPLGTKLVRSGVLQLKELEELLEQYRPFANSQRFGEFLKLNQRVSPAVVDLLLNPSLFDKGGFNQKRLGEKLLELGCINEQQLIDALAQQQLNGHRIGEILAGQGLISAEMALFFAEAKVTPGGQIEFCPT